MATKRKAIRETFLKLNNAHAIRRKRKIVSIRVSNTHLHIMVVRAVHNGIINPERSESQRPRLLAEYYLTHELLI
jgi:hypothetical protein